MVVTGNSLWLNEEKHEDKQLNGVLLRSRNDDG